MMKIYKDISVYDAALDRLQTILTSFEHVYFSVSGGKDSSVMLQLAAQVAREVGAKFDILFIDLEAQYRATIDHLMELKEAVKDVTNTFFWVALPISLRNAVSVIQPKWICWNKEDRKHWVRDMPSWAINEDSNIFPFFRHGMEFEHFTLDFTKWYAENNGLSAAGIGIRSDESLNRFRTIISKTKEPWNGYAWTTYVKDGGENTGVVNFYPMYDWATEDIWIAVGRYNLIFNQIYELMYKNGLSIHEQRLCQPYGDDQRNGLDQFRALEPETWNRVLERVHGVNFGNIYARSSLLGNMRTEKPKHMTWEQYAVFLLETIGIAAPELRDHYTEKIKTFLAWHEAHEGVNVSEIPEEADLKEEAAKKTASWRRIARAIEKNDFWMSRLSFSQTKNDVARMFELKEKYANLIYAKDADTASLRRVAKELNND
ncbi:MAG: DUF3440 domain-containing protein [Clostridiaceae bacterium]|nr:DUF3440 domain-containing protein [Clostridiaceae bacterium]